MKTTKYLTTLRTLDDCHDCANSGTTSTSAKSEELRASRPILRRGFRQMQAPTLQEIDQLDQMDIVIGLSDGEARYLLRVWRICAQAAATPAPKRTIDDFRRTVSVKREML